MESMLYYTRLHISSEGGKLRRRRVPANHSPQENSQRTHTPADTSFTADLSLFFGGSCVFDSTALFGTKVINIFLSLKFLLSSVASYNLQNQTKVR